MNWHVTGKTTHGKRGRLTIVGGPDTDEGVRVAVAGSHPGFQVETVTALNGALKPLISITPIKEDNGPRIVPKPGK